MGQHIVLCCLLLALYCATAYARLSKARSEERREKLECAKNPSIQWVDGQPEPEVVREMECLGCNTASGIAYAESTERSASVSTTLGFGMEMFSAELGVELTAVAAKGFSHTCDKDDVDAPPGAKITCMMKENIYHRYTGRVSGRDAECNDLDGITTITVPVVGGLIGCDWPASVEAITAYNGGEGCEMRDTGFDPVLRPLV